MRVGEDAPLRRHLLRQDGGREVVKVVHALVLLEDGVEARRALCAKLKPAVARRAAHRVPLTQQELPPAAALHTLRRLCTRPRHVSIGTCLQRVACMRVRRCERPAQVRAPQWGLVGCGGELPLGGAVAPGGTTAASTGQDAGRQEGRPGKRSGSKAHCGR